MKAVWVVPGLFISGGMRIIVEYANRLQKKGHDCCLISLMPLPKNLNETFFSMSVPAYNASELERVAANADAVIATGYQTVESVIKCSTSGRRYYFVQNRESYFWGKPRHQRRIERLYSLPLIPIVVSHWLEAVLRLHGKDSFVVHNGLDLGIFEEQPGKRPEHMRVLVEGQGSPWKRLRMAVQACRDAKVDEIWTLTVRSSSSDVEGADRILNEVSTEEVVEAYSSCTAMIKLADFEGAGLTIMEAMACGCPVVTTNGPGMVEYCVDGHNCLLVPKWDLEEAVKALQRLRDHNLCKILSDEGKLTVRREFMWDDKVDSMELALSGKVSPAEMPCPFHSTEEQQLFIEKSYPYTLPFWDSLKVLGKHAPFGPGRWRDRVVSAIYKAVDGY